jgi:hypothetical protein
MFWVDGVPSNVKHYGDSVLEIKQNTPEYITIGSDNCDVYVYMVKAYERYLTKRLHKNNFIVDTSNTEELLRRYNRNDILDNNGYISYSKLLEKNPDCNIFLYEIPRMTNNKEDPVDGCYYEHYKTNINVPDETAENVTIKV